MNNTLNLNGPMMNFHNPFTNRQTQSCPFCRMSTRFVRPVEPIKNSAMILRGKANTVVNALTRLALADPAIRLEIFTALTLERPDPAGDDPAGQFVGVAQGFKDHRFPGPATRHPG